MLDVMIVDDSDIIRNIFSKGLHHLGHNVVGMAKNGKEAVDMYENLKPDLVTMDITMPIMDGMEALKKILEVYPNAVIVMITSHGEEKLVMESISSGAKGYILKPITHKKVEQAIFNLFPKYKK